MQNHFAAPDGARLAYRDEGSGTPVLALAGLTRDGRDFDYLARHLGGRVRLIRLDARGRGGSQWTGWQSYTVLQEAQDAVALLDHLSVARAAIVGTSRGGLLGMLIAATARPRLAGLCLVDVGPVLERTGLERLGRHVGLPPTQGTLEEVAGHIRLSRPGFVDVPGQRWAEEAARHYTRTGTGIGLPYDPDLRQSFAASMAAPPADLWPLFDACAGLPLALVRGANSDILARPTADEMQRRRPDMIRAEVPGRGHVPFLDEAESLAAIGAWLAEVARRPADQPAAPAK